MMLIAIPRTPTALKR